VGTPDARPPDARQADAAGAPDAGAPDAQTFAAVLPLPATSCTPIEYEGNARPQLLLASDLPVTGFSQLSIRQINNAIRYELRARGWKAGPYHVAFQACDDSLAGESWDGAKCMANALAYAANPAVVGVVGTFNSGCAGLVIPILNEAAGGGVAMVSPANTSTCLTTRTATCDEGRPDSLYPSGTRNYARVVPHDVYQGAAQAEHAKALGVSKVYVLDDGDAYGVGVATAFKNAATFLDIAVVGTRTFHGDDTSFTETMEAAQAAGANAIYIGGFTTDVSIQVIKDKVAVLGPNTGAVKLLLPDGFAEFVLSEASDGAADGAITSVPGIAPELLTGAAAEFAARFQTEVLGGEDFEAFTVPGIEAARVLLDAIARSDGTRSDVIAEVFKTNVTGGLLGSYHISATGDPTGGGGTSYTFYHITADGLEADTTRAPAAATVEAALGD